MRYEALVERVKSAVFGQGATAPEMRRAAADQRLNDLPNDLRDYVTKVGKHAYRVTDDDVAALNKAGYSEDQIFEITAATAVGAALSRLETGMRVLRESAR